VFWKKSVVGERLFVFRFLAWANSWPSNQTFKKEGNRQNLRAKQERRQLQLSLCDARNIFKYRVCVEKKKYCLHQVRVRSFFAFGRVFERARGERMRENLLLLFFYLSLNGVLSKIANRCPLSLSILRAKFLPLLLANAKNKDKTHREEEKSSIRSNSDVFFSLSSCARARVG